MAKKSAFVMKMQAQKNAELMASRMFAVQQSKDIMLLAAAEEFGFGPERLKRLSQAFDKKFTEYCKLVIGDTADIEYTKAKMDQALQQVCGEYFVPWDERYGWI